VTRQETTFTRTISRSQRLQTENYINMTSQSECERCFETYVVIFTYIFRCSG